MRVAIVYDRVNKWGGAERVLLTLHEMFPDAPLFTSIYNPQKAPWAKVFPKVVPSFLQKLPIKKHELLAPLMPIAFESFDMTRMDLVISVTSEAAKGIITKPGTKHICYCLTPTRYLWSGYKDYFKSSIFKSITKPVVSYLRKWDKTAASRPDTMIAISTEVQKRIKKYYGRDSRVVYPPVFKFKTQKAKFKNEIQNSKFFLIVSRLVPYKRVDLAVEAFNKLGLPLVIVGTGSQEKKLRKIAKANIKFAGYLTDEELVGYYQKAEALVVPQREDFGLVAVEAQSFGVPVIAYKAGGALDTVIEGVTGRFFDHQSVESLTGAIKESDKNDYNKKAVKNNAEKFSKERFKREFLKLI